MKLNIIYNLCQDTRINYLFKIIISMKAKTLVAVLDRYVSFNKF